MFKDRSGLVLALASLLIFVLLALGLFLGQIFKSFYLDTFHDRMEREASLVAYYVNEQGLSNPLFTDKMDKLSDSLKTRVAILDKNASVLYDSARSDDEIENIETDNLKQLINSRLSDTSDFHVIEETNDTYYYGLPLKQAEQLSGFVILSSSVDSLQKVNHQIWMVLIGSLGLALTVILIMGTRIATRYAKPIKSATNVAIELAKGNYKARTYENQFDETESLSQSLNILARNLQDVTKAHEMEQDRLRTLIENMGSGLVLINERGYINLINRAYKEIFNVDPEEYLFQLYNDAITQNDIVSIVQEVFLTEKKVRKQVNFPMELERKHFEVYGAPIISAQNEWKGVLLVFHDITELKKLEQMRKDFVANVSHELRTPITSIKGFSETLLDGAMQDEQALKDFLMIILKESDRLQNVIDYLLELSRIEQHGFKLNIYQVNIQSLLMDTYIMLKDKAIEKEIDFRIMVEKEPIFIMGDANRLKQVFINIVNNSIAYTPKEGKITIEVHESTDEVEVIVSDTGIGIAENELPRLFERFYRVDKARSRNSGGTGLGLAIVKHIIEVHQGHVSVKSKIGIGTTFSVILKKEI